MAEMKNKTNRKRAYDLDIIVDDFDIAGYNKKKIM